MAAANKASQTRGKRSQAPSTVSSNLVDADIDQGVKQEDLQATIPMHQRPGTSTGYEGSGPDSNGLVYHPNASARTWHVQTANVDRPNSRPVNSHSFRDPSQSFRAPSAASSITASANVSSHASAPQHGQPTQSFLASRDPFELGFASDGTSRTRSDVRPGSSASRPTTASLESSDAHPRSLPPLAAVVSSSLPPSQWGGGGGSPHSRYFHFHQGQVSAQDDHQQQLAQGPLPPHTTPPALPLGVEALEWGLDPTYPFPPSMDAPSAPPSWHPSSHRQDPLQAMPETAPRLPSDTTRHFPSTRRHSPNQGPQAHPHRLPH
ncbi:hypothetical protein EVG20_g11644, partial [Dentipellis fragilis]